MPQDTLYLDSTIPSYIVSRPSRDILVLGRQQITQEWWQLHKTDFSIHISQVVLDEIQRGDTELAKKRFILIKPFRLLDISPEVEHLAEKLVKLLNIPYKAYGDAFHLAFTMHYQINYLLTWNCAHLANGLIRHKLRHIEDELEVISPTICTPEELMDFSWEV